MHARNRHQSRYNLKELSQVSQELAPFVFTNQYGAETIDFSDPQAVKYLNQALLKSSYNIQWWDLPSDFLCPPIPGRADLVHYLADLLASSNENTIPRNVQALDVGVGANCIYPLIGQHEYGWNFIGSEVSEAALESAQKIVKRNNLEKKIDLRLQTDSKAIFQNILKSEELVDVTLCNPPFHTSAEEAQRGSARKSKNLNLKKEILNFGGRSLDLWCPGGEVAFVSQMIKESALYQKQCLWFTSLISKSENLSKLKDRLVKVKAFDVRVLEMSQGQKISRLLAWTFKNPAEHNSWARKRWSQE